MTKKATSPAKLIVNRRARFDYALQEQLTVGIVLTGPEVRAVRDGRVSLRGAFVTIKNDELWLNNASFSLPQTADGREVAVDTRPRKLLAKRKEIKQLAEAKDKGLTIVPIHMTTSTRHIKVEIAAAKGKKLYDKREAIKRRDTEREQQRLMKR